MAHVGVFSPICQLMARARVFSPIGRLMVCTGYFLQPVGTWRVQGILSNPLTHGTCRGIFVLVIKAPNQSSDMCQGSKGFAFINLNITINLNIFKIILLIY
jgi:hypothetical protein